MKRTKPPDKGKPSESRRQAKNSPSRPVKKTKSKKSASYWKKKCDTLWGRIIRSKGYCEICGRSDGQLHAHHLIGRSAVFFRHNLNNGVCLCPMCHQFDVICSAHTAPRKFLDEIRLKKPDQWKWWSKNHSKVITGQTIDYEQVYEMLKEQSND